MKSKEPVRHNPLEMDRVLLPLALEVEKGAMRLPRHPAPEVDNIQKLVNQPGGL